VLSSLRSPDPAPTPLEPSPGDVGGPCLPLGRCLGHLVRRMGPTGPDRGRAKRASTLDASPVAGPTLGPEARHPSWSRTRPGGRTRARVQATVPGRAGRLLEGLSVPGARRDRTTPVRLLSPEPSVAGVLRVLSHRRALGMPGMRSPAVSFARAKVPTDHGPNPSVTGFPSGPLQRSGSNGPRRGTEERIRLAGLAT
jgi:hypothetical protein